MSGTKDGNGRMSEQVIEYLYVMLCSFGDDCKHFALRGEGIVENNDCLQWVDESQ